MNTTLLSISNFLCLRVHIRVILAVSVLIVNYSLVVHHASKCSPASSAAGWELLDTFEVDPRRNGIPEPSEQNAGKIQR